MKEENQTIDRICIVNDDDEGVKGHKGILLSGFPSNLVKELKGSSLNC